MGRRYARCNHDGRLLHPDDKLIIKEFAAWLKQNSTLQKATQEPGGGDAESVGDASEATDTNGAQDLPT